MNFDVAHWTIFACLQILYDTTFTDCRGKKETEIFSSHYADNRQLNSACEMALRLLAANDIRINDHLALLTLTGV